MSPQLVPMTRVELTISAKGLKNKDTLSKSDPLCIVSTKERWMDHYTEVARTEMITDTLNPQWIRKVEMDYRFEEKQCLQFTVYDWDNKSSDPNKQDKLGFVECSLGEIMSSGATPLSKTIEEGTGVLLLQGQEMSGSKEVITMNLTGSDLDKKDLFGKSDPYLVFLTSSDGVSYMQTFKSEILRKTLNPVWKPMIVPARILCAGDHNQSIKIECYDWDKRTEHDLIGECYTTLGRLLEGPGSNNVYQLMNENKKAKKSNYKDSGKLILQSITSHVEPSFLDYIRGGTNLHFSVAVDFTISNGEAKSITSLHYSYGGRDTPYCKAIRAVGNVIEDYDSDKMFPALGFGAKVPPRWRVHHEFFLNLSEDNPYCQGIDEIVKAYHNCLKTIEFFGPTCFAPIINHTAKFAQAYQDGNNYFVMLILTDGVICDMKDTRRALVAASDLPMSIIIVGIGNEDFTAMQELDGDEARLSCDGKYASRDIVQFVEMRKYLDSNGQARPELHTLLAKDVLAEIPKQLVSWMRTHGYQPRPPSLEGPVNTYGLEYKL